MQAIAVLFAAALAATPAIAARDFNKGVLDAHNRERAALRVPPLTWSEWLAVDAAGWAAHLVKLHNLIHATRAERNQEGENLWMGTAGGFGPDSVVGYWLAEK